MDYTNFRVQEVACVEADGIQDGGDLAEVLVDGENWPAWNESTARRRYEDAVHLPGVVEPRTVHVILRSFHPAAVQLYSTRHTIFKVYSSGWVFRRTPGFPREHQ